MSFDMTLLCQPSNHAAFQVRPNAESSLCALGVLDNDVDVNSGPINHDEFNLTLREAVAVVVFSLYVYVTLALEFCAMGFCLVAAPFNVII